MDRLLRLWFRVAVLMIVLYAGWAMARFAPALVASVAVLLALVAVMFGVQSRRDTPHGKKRHRIHWKGVVPAAAIFCVFCVGWITSVLNPLNVNEWMDNSAEYARNILTPAGGYSQHMRPVLMSEAQKRGHEENASKLTFSGYDVGHKLLVSFMSGLAIIDGQKAQFVSGTGVMLSLTHLLPDGSFIYYWPNDRKPMARVQRLARAVITDGQLHLIWERGVIGLYVHHWGDEFRGELYHPGRIFEPVPASFPRAPLKHDGVVIGDCGTERDIHDQVRIFDIETGMLKRSIDLIKLIDSPEGKDISRMINFCGDVLHTNDIHVLKTEQEAAYFPDGKVGDILVSMRNVNTMMLIDAAGTKIKWHVTDLTKQQHAPRITDRGTIIVFDNLGSTHPQNGRARIAEIDIKTRQLVGTWEAPDGQKFDARFRGKIDIDGNKLFVQDQNVYESTNQMFVLECPSYPVSNACIRKPVFTGKRSEYLFDNAVFCGDDCMGPTEKSPD